MGIATTARGIRTRRYAFVVLSLLPLAASLFAAGQSVKRPTLDPIAALKERIASGDAKLSFESGHGYLKSLLRELDIDASSQMLVFSKTSLQSDFIGPKTPRAIYFNAETYVGWIPGAPLIEIATVDSEKGVLFYTIRNDKTAPAAFQTETKQCTRCHGAIGPNLFASSVLTAPSGYPRAFERSYRASPDLPLRERWGGWYVSGTHGTQRHLGNELSLGTDESNRIDIERGANVTDLRRYFDVRPYLSPNSDIAALMVFEQQMEIQNVLFRARRAIANDPTDVADACENVVEALLCSGEAKLSSSIVGTGEFAKAYVSSAPKDQQGRSLSELDLRTRVLKYPCSPLIYSPSFDALPEVAKKQIWKRLGEILSAKDTDSSFAYLSASDRAAILAILIDTKPEFARSLSGN